MNKSSVEFFSVMGRPTDLFHQNMVEWQLNNNINLISKYNP